MDPRLNRSILSRLLSELSSADSGGTIELPWLGHSSTHSQLIGLDADFPSKPADDEEFEQPKIRTFSISAIGDYWEERKGVTAFHYTASGLPVTILVALHYLDFKTKVFPPEKW